LEARANPFIDGQIDFVIFSRLLAEGDVPYFGGVLMYVNARAESPAQLFAPLSDLLLQAGYTGSAYVNPLNLYPANYGSRLWCFHGYYRSTFNLRLSGGNIVMDLWLDGNASGYPYNQFYIDPISGFPLKANTDHIGFTSGVIGTLTGVTAPPKLKKNANIIFR
jgi:hypothetical protein